MRKRIREFICRREKIDVCVCERERERERERDAGVLNIITHAFLLSSIIVG